MDLKLLWPSICMTWRTHLPLTAMTSHVAGKLLLHRQLSLPGNTPPPDESANLRICCLPTSAPSITFIFAGSVHTICHDARQHYPGAARTTSNLSKYNKSLTRHRIN